MKKPELYKLEKSNDAVIVYRTDKNYGRQGVVYQNTVRYEYTPYLIPRYIRDKCRELLKTSTMLAVMIIIWCNASSQVFTGLNLASNGAGLSIGAESNNIAFTVLMSHPYRNSEQDSYYAMQLGKIIPLDEDKGYIIGLHAGAAYCNKKVIKDEVTQLTTFKGIYTAEIGRNMGTGRLSLICYYVGAVSYGISLKCFF